MYNELTKNEFTEIISELQKASTYQKEVELFFKKSGIIGFIDTPDCSDSVLRLLHIVYAQQDKDNIISFFCNDLDYGKNYKKEVVKEHLGIEIPLKNSEDLYHYLCQELKENE